MKWSPLDRLLDWLLLAIQIGLLVATALVVPLLLRPRFFSYIAYSLLAGVLWLANAVGAMIYDGKVGNDVPGAGYLVVGFVGWFIGSVVFAVRRTKGNR